MMAYMSENAAENGDQKGFPRNMILTIVLGLLFMFGVGYEWYEAYQHFPPHTIFGTVFFKTTGVHATYVFSGVILLVIVYFKGRKAGAFGSSNYWGVEGAVKYWHFVDAAWIFIYPTPYLVK
jgi:heme/copper-type cytochrome/quinol oxidase subunit 3